MANNSQKLAYLNALEIPVWVDKNREISSTNSLSSEDMPEKIQKNTKANNTQQTDTSISGLNLTQLKQCVQDCTACELHKTRTQTVFGVGNTQADIMVIGEAPGYYEDQQGEPFVGRAGQLLNAMFQSIGLSREEIFIANILKCRPPNNRDPLPSEVESCTKFLQQQINLIQPKVLCAVGRVAGRFLLNTELSLARLRNQTHYYGGTRSPLIITYHPAYLLRNPSAKAQSYSDLLRLKEIIASENESSSP